MAKQLPIISRTCGECTKCCEGWLSGTIYGHRMQRGRGCFYLEEKCSIYAERPETPCKQYSCAWLIEDVFPGWMKPNLSGVIITKVSTIVPYSLGMNKVEYYDVIETAGKIDSSVLNWLITWAIDNDINLAYEVDGGRHVVGDEEFKNFFQLNQI